MTFKKNRKGFVSLGNILGLLFYVFLTFIIGNCMTGLKNVYKHKSFSYPNTIENNFLVAEIVFSDNIKPSVDSRRYVNMLTYNIRNRGFKVLSPDAYPQKIRQKYRKRIRESGPEIGFGEEDYKIFQKNLKNVKYLVFVFIDLEELKKTDRDILEENQLVAREFISSRMMEGHIRVYDIQNRFLAYAATNRTTKENKKHHSMGSGGVLGTIQGVSSLVSTLSGDSHPDYPTRDTILRSMFKTFAGKGLPKEN